jgi:hypothetical protein
MICGHDKDFQKVSVTIQFDRKVQNKSQECVEMTTLHLHVPIV